ncbi:MAG TPA: hypothetical protein VKZ63_03990 [Kofleriaceae bacterium]|nr:hypothetical protein [Kofleriaceae bacterium]
MGPLAGLAAAVAGCTTAGPGGSCGGGKCDSAGDFQSELDGRGDPIAEFLRGAEVDRDGVMEADYRTFLLGVAEVMGCTSESVMTFSLSDNLFMAEPFPRLISVACSDDDARASDFFIAASFRDDATGDVDLRDVEMFAWDQAARTYRFYAFQPAESDPSKVAVEVEPKRCQQCHLTPSDLVPLGMPMTPIMNELDRPWTHWNAEPGFPSFQYDLPDGMESMPNFAEVMGRHRGAASRLEEIIRRGGHPKVAQARLRTRRDPADLDQVMHLLRPLFCSEQVNYVSEDFHSGVLFSSAVVDPGLRNMFRAIRPSDWPWGWVNGDTMRIAAPTGETVTQIPVRGNADVTTEQQMVAVRALTPYQVLRVRALDWKRPVFSELRCGLWTGAVERFRTDPPSLAGLERNSDAMPVVFEAIMRLGGQPLDPGQPELFIAAGDGGPEAASALEQALADGTIDSATCGEDGSGFCVVDVEQFGEMVHRHLRSFEEAADPRPALIEERDRRICEILAPVEPVDDRFEEPPIRFENRPALPIECPGPADGLAD